MTPGRVFVLPDRGRVVLAHPDVERDAVDHAAVEGCPYMLRRFMPKDRTHMIDLDAIPAASWVPAPPKMDPW